MRKKLIVGNWKMNYTITEAEAFVSSIKDRINTDIVDVAICPNFVALGTVSKLLENTNIHLGAQNVYYEDKGAYTGETSAPMLVSAFVDFCIVGHSERRSIFNETDEMINKKVKKLLENNIKPIICVGETLEQREAGVTDSHIASQIRAALEGISSEDVAKSVIAYEPIWAIGTGKSCDADEANRVIKMIRGVVAEVAGSQAADAIRILYGGSVKPNTIEEQMAKSDIDGALIGGASLKADSFNEIIEKTMKVAV